MTLHLAYFRALNEHTFKTTHYWHGDRKYFVKKVFMGVTKLFTAQTLIMSGKYNYWPLNITFVKFLSNPAHAEFMPQIMYKKCFMISNVKSI